MSQQVFTRKHVIDLIDNLLQYPDQLKDAVSNEHTDWDASNLLELTESSLSPTPIEYEPTGLSDIISWIENRKFTTMDAHWAAMEIKFKATSMLNNHVTH